jgi:hypothetical protein
MEGRILSGYWWPLNSRSERTNRRPDNIFVVLFDSVVMVGTRPDGPSVLNGANCANTASRPCTPLY